MSERCRGLSPVIGVVLMLALTLLLASAFAAGVAVFGDELDGERFEESVTTVATNRWSGSPGDLVRLSSTEAGAAGVTYRVNFTIQSGSSTVGNSLNSVYLEVTTGSPDLFSDTEQADLESVRIDEDSDGTTEQEITGDVDGWQVQNGGSALKIGFSGSAYTAQADDSVVVVFDGAKNPNTAGSYDLQAQTSGDGNWHYGTIDVTN